MAKKPKPSKLELLDAEIAKWHRAQERALLMERKALRTLKRSAIEIARLAKRRAKLEREAASSPEADAPPAPVPAEVPAVMVPAAAAVEPEPAMDDPNHPDLVAARELLAGVNGKPKRKRKPKMPPGYDPEKPTNIPLSEFLGNPSAPPESVDREARMKSFGFRKTANRPKA